MTMKHKVSAVLIAAGVVFASQSVATAQEVSTEVPMAHPTGGVHTIKFFGNSWCGRADDSGKATQVATFGIRDLNVQSSTARFFIDPNKLFPFNSATVQWKNTATGAQGSKTFHKSGFYMDMPVGDVGFGEVEATMTVTRSLLPTLSPGSAIPFFSSTHTETLKVAGVAATACENSLKN
ncbi:hypothetical protein P4N68_12140 [Corynebacterium felinum]|uniref:Uncharacterized protein n=1 Tax=Corynebacterium felinum TaxID=131318 RepID=A0ABU2B9T4_9CORY|nr:hypothetical protein [Corynebacterium felinum]MDF5821816.1 hypothetical protein [Corynebacterium felinum]MDR7355375.1 hypothetical protein [Corynebacterium felinum]WJY94727.1 hypothetical protein CFELI_05495 [Corynebacterium felinum]